MSETDTPSFARAFGLRLRANRIVPGLLDTEGIGFDVDLSLEQVESLPALIPDEDESEHYAHDSVRVLRDRAGKQYRFAYQDGPQFSVLSDGSRVRSVWDRSGSLERTATYLVGPILGFVLRLRGQLCLHASTVLVDGQAVAFVGPSGSGKSTLATEFLHRGYPVLTDDISALSMSDQQWMVEPGHPRIRLWPASVEHFFGDPERLPRLSSRWEKRYLEFDLPLPRAFPLRAVYLLTIGERLTLETRSPSATVIGMVANTYANYLLDDAMRKRELALLSAVVEKTAVKCLAQPADLHRVGETCDFVLSDLGAR